MSGPIVFMWGLVLIGIGLFIPITLLGLIAAGYH